MFPFKDRITLCKVIYNKPVAYDHVAAARYGGLPKRFHRADSIRSRRSRPTSDRHDYVAGENTTVWPTRSDRPERCFGAARRIILHWHAVG